MKYLSQCYGRRAQFYQDVKHDNNAALNDYANAIKAYPDPFYYLQFGLIHWQDNNLLQATRFFQKSLVNDPEVIKKYPEEVKNIENTVAENKKEIPESCSAIMTLLDSQKKACGTTQNFSEFIEVFNQHVIIINKKLEELHSNDKMERLTLLEELQQPKQAKKSIPEMAKIYNDHVNKINEQLFILNIKPITKLEIPLTLLSLARLVAIQSDLFKTKKIKVPSEIATAAQDPFTQLMNALNVSVEENPLKHPMSSTGP